MTNNVKCIKCGNEFSLLISGKPMCLRCSRDEIIHRVKRNLVRSGVDLRNSSLTILSPEFYSGVGEILANLIRKVCEPCNVSLRKEVITGEPDINSTIHELVVKVLESENRYFASLFTADFYLAYLIYSSTRSLNGAYLNLYGLRVNVGEKTVLNLLYNTPYTELRGFSELTPRLITGDSLFDSILSWSHDRFPDNEVFHTFSPSVEELTRLFPRCRRCGAIISAGDYCKACEVDLSLVQ